MEYKSGTSYVLRPNVGGARRAQLDGNRLTLHGESNTRFDWSPTVARESIPAEGLCVKDKSG